MFLLNENIRHGALARDLLQCVLEIGAVFYELVVLVGLEMVAMGGF